MSSKLQDIELKKLLQYAFERKKRYENKICQTWNGFCFTRVYENMLCREIVLPVHWKEGLWKNIFFKSVSPLWS